MIKLGSKLLFCKKCNRKRFSTRISIRNHNFRWTCSKGHSWITEGLTLERIAAVLEDVFTPEKIKNIFERDDVFFRSFKK